MANELTGVQSNKAGIDKVNHTATGKIAAILGGLLALLLGFAGFVIGYRLATYSEFPPEAYPPEMRREIESNTLQGEDIPYILPGIACMAGGLLGFAGALIVFKRPDISGKLLLAGGILTVLSVIGMIAAIILFIGGYQAYRYSTLTPEKRSERVQDEDDGEEPAY